MVERQLLTDDIIREARWQGFLERLQRLTAEAVARHDPTVLVPDLVAHFKLENTLDNLLKTMMLRNIPASMAYRLTLEAALNIPLPEGYQGDPAGSDQQWPLIWHPDEHDMIVYG